MICYSVDSQAAGSAQITIYELSPVDCAAAGYAVGLSSTEYQQLSTLDMTLVENHLSSADIAEVFGISFGLVVLCGSIAYAVKVAKNVIRMA